ncbi:MAG: iron ABC transporter permease [Candidatus Methanoplasma sp.]|jgi:iron complex transport system permease protein|nr:iron ABC transporter permease [Candidatus Methanoplasma sp.]
MRKPGPKLLILISFLLLVVSAAVAVCIGTYHISITDVFSAYITYFQGGETTVVESIVVNLRTPRVILALMAGAGLAVAGTASQSAFSNPLASPDVIGVSSGAAFGAAAGILLFNNDAATQLMAVAFGLAAIAAVFALCKSSRSDSILMIVLSGIIVAGLFSAMVSLVKYVADPMSKLPEITYWLMGTLSGASYSKIIVALPMFVAGMVLIYVMKWRLNILTLSDDEVRALGHNPKKVRWTAVLASTLVVAAVVSVCGLIGWIGLVIPHVARLLVGTDNRYVLPLCISIGGIFMLAMDTVARTASVEELPLSILTAIVGAPLFASIFIWRGRGWT